MWEKLLPVPRAGKYVTNAMRTTKYYQRRRAKTYRYCHTLSARKIGYPLLAQKKRKMLSVPCGGNVTGVKHGKAIDVSGGVLRKKTYPFFRVLHCC